MPATATAAPAAPAPQKGTPKMRPTVLNEAYWICAQTGITPLAIGMPGVAKSSVVYAFGRAMGRPVYTLIASLRDPADIGGYPYPSKNGDGTATMKLIPPQWAHDCQNGQWILFFDEATTCAAAVQAALLRVIAEKVVGDTPLARDTLILAACNPPEQAANGIEFEAAMANRMYHHKWVFPRSDWRKGQLNRLNYPEPSFPRLPDDWRKHLGATCPLMVAFTDRKPSLFEAFPKDRAQACGPWPSPRTWTHAGVCMAAAQSVGASPSVEHELVAGLVGELAAREFSEWRESLDLPDPEELIAEAVSAIEAGRDMDYHHPNRADKVIAMLSAVNQVVLDENTPKRWEAGMSVMEHAARYQMDVALAGAGTLTRAIPKGARMSADIVAKLFPRIKQALID